MDSICSTALNTLVLYHMATICDDDNVRCIASRNNKKMLDIIWHIILLYTEKEVGVNDY